MQICQEVGVVLNFVTVKKNLGKFDEFLWKLAILVEIAPLCSLIPVHKGAMSLK